MPALKEEEQTSAFQWFDGTDLSTTVETKQVQPMSNITEEALVDDFDWVFGNYGLGDAIPTESTLFAAFRETEPATILAPSQVQVQPRTISPVLLASTSQSNTVDLSYEMPLSPSHTAQLSSWLNTSAQDVVVPAFDLLSPAAYSSPAANTIDPMAVMVPNNSDERPSSAPGLNGGDGSGLLSVPMGDTMTRR
jgi:hypothetical protein